MENRDYWKDFQEAPKSKSTLPVNPEMANQFSTLDQQKAKETWEATTEFKTEFWVHFNNSLNSAVNRLIVTDATVLANWNINIGPKWEATYKYMVERWLASEATLNVMIAQAINSKNAQGWAVEQSSESIMA